MRVKGLEPPRRKAPDPKSGASANSAKPAIMTRTGLEPVTHWLKVNCSTNWANESNNFRYYGPDGNRTRDLRRDRATW